PILRGRCRSKRKITTSVQTNVGRWLRAPAQARDDEWIERRFRPVALPIPSLLQILPTPRGLSPLRDLRERGVSVRDQIGQAKTAFVFAGGGSFGAIQVGMLHS